MSITVAEIMELPVMRHACIAAGEKGLSRKVQSLAMMEDGESAAYLQANNLVITNGRVVASNLTNLSQFVDSLCMHNIAGIALKTGRYFDEVPHYLASSADAIGMPVIVIPDDITSSQLISSISYAIFSSEAHNTDIPYEVDLIRSIIIENDDWRTLKNRLITAGLDVQSKMGVIVIKRMDEEISNSILPICIECGFIYPFPLYGNYVACINLNGETSSYSVTLKHARLLEDRLKQAYPGSSWRIGTSKTRNNLLTLALSYKEALAALCFGIATESVNRTVTFADLGIYALILLERNRQDVNLFLARVSAMLDYHDKAHNTELKNTLYTYAACHMSISDTAAALYVHNNTVRYRIDSIKKLLAEQIVPEEVGVNLEMICTLARWVDVFNRETKHSASPDSLETPNSRSATAHARTQAKSSLPGEDASGSLSAE